MRIDPGSLDIDGSPIHYPHVFIVPPIGSDTGFALFGSYDGNSFNGSFLVLNAALDEIYDLITNPEDAKKLLRTYLWISPLFYC